MCMDVMFFQDDSSEGQPIDTVNGLERAIGKRVLDKQGKPLGVENLCLCEADLVATANDAGYDLMEGWEYGCWFTMKPKGVSIRP